MKNQKKKKLRNINILIKEKNLINSKFLHKDKRNIRIFLASLYSLLFLLSWCFIKWGVGGLILAGGITIFIEVFILYILYPIYTAVKLKRPVRFYRISSKKFYEIDKMINNFYEKQIEEKYIIKIEDILQLKKDLNNKVNELLEDRKSNFELNLDKISNIIFGTVVASLLNSYHLSLFKNEIKIEELTSRLFLHLGIYFYSFI